MLVQLSAALEEPTDSLVSAPEKQNHCYHPIETDDIKEYLKAGIIHPSKDIFITLNTCSKTF